MKTYYIYEIPGVKIGCTDDLPARQKAQRDKGELIVLESHTCIDRASEREQELQRSNGYPVDDKTYKYIIQVMNPKAKTPEAIKKKVATYDYKSKDTIKKRVANTDYKARTANTDFKAFQAKRIANTDLKARTAKIDYKGSQSHRQRAVTSISPEGVITKHTGVSAAARDLTKRTGLKFNPGGISNVCNPKRPLCKTYKGYRFEYTHK